MEPAAALASIVKACLMIERRTFLPQALFESKWIPHPDIDWSGGHLCILQSVTAARAETLEHPLTIGINAFGFGGSNTHAILVSPSQRKAHIDIYPSNEKTEQLARWIFADVSGPDDSRQPTTARTVKLEQRCVCLPLSAHNSESLKQLGSIPHFSCL